jgi:hypothetical protein
MTTTTLHNPNTANPEAGDEAAVETGDQLRRSGNLPAANTNATVLAIAERAAAIMSEHDPGLDLAGAVYTTVA